MAISRRKVLRSTAALGVLSISDRVFSPAIAQNKPLRVGVLAPRAGIAAAPGLNGIRATQWAVEGFNAKDGIGGRKVELVIEDEFHAQGHNRALQQARAAGKSRLRARHHFHGRRPCPWSCG